MHTFAECLVFRRTDRGPNNPVPHGAMYKESVIISGIVQDFEQRCCCLFQLLLSSGVSRNFVRGGSTNSVEDRENGDLGAVAP